MKKLLEIIAENLVPIIITICVFLPMIGWFLHRYTDHIIRIIEALKSP